MSAKSHSSEDFPPIPLTEVAAHGGLDPACLIPYGGWAARVPWQPPQRSAGRPRAKMILVTAATPTEAGIGKTVTTIGIADALTSQGQKTIACLRQPALGPTLGMKGGGAGGGRCRILPTDRVNLGLLGDFDAISHAQNLLVATGENSRFFGDPHGFGTAPLLQRRAWHLNDRALRRIVTHPDGAGKVAVATGMDLVAACETMFAVALAKDPSDLRARVGRMVVALDKSGAPVTADQLEVGGAMMALLRDVSNPTLLSTAEGSCVLIHAGPFANLGPGVSGVIADRIAVQAADYVVTEAGFGADLGGEKFLDLKVPAGSTWPDAAVLVTTVASYVQHRAEGDADPLEKGLDNLSAHLDNMARFGVPTVVVLNRHPADDPALVSRILQEAERRGAASAVESLHFAHGSEGGQAMATAVRKAAERASTPKSIYAADAPVKEKVEAVATQIYGAGSVEWSEAALQGLKLADSLGLGRARPCIAKTQYSLSADPKQRGRPHGFVLPIRDVRVMCGPGLVVPLVGAIMTLPGLPARPGSADYDFDPISGTIIHR